MASPRPRRAAPDRRIGKRREPSAGARRGASARGRGSVGDRASRSRLVRQMLTEALVWTFLGAAAGVLFAGWGSRVLMTMMSTWKDPIALDVSPNWHVLIFTLMLVFLTIALSAVLPGLRATRLDPNAALKDGGHVGGSLLGGWSLNKALVGAQVALAVLLLVGAALFIRSLQRVLAQDPGFEPQNLLVLSTDPIVAGYKDARLTTFHAGLLERIGSLPGVESASLSDPPISDDMGHWTQSIAVDGAPAQPKGERTCIQRGLAEVLSTLGIRLLRGRPFAERTPIRRRR